ncbi:SAV_915 family protein [Streptomyces sp. SS]|uniref:SAV_915 family protein n=1 Tax=Streptomyces sp. SS TaxID=260742 RepID=UPI0002D5F32B|nr:SAV_915 family protein [Streptomyces sp. SS]
MSAAVYGDEPEPGEQLPAGRLCVPVRPGAGGCVTRLFRTPVGGRTAVAFSGPARLRAVLGAAQPWIVLAEPALRALMEPLGVRELRIDPVLTARPPEAPVDGRTPEVPTEGTPVGVTVGVTAAGAESLPGSRPLAGIAK